MDILIVDLLVILAVATAFLIVCYVVLNWSSNQDSQHILSSFDQNWPPISEEEFIQRCPIGTRPQVALKVREIIAAQSGIPYDQIYPEQSFVGDLGWD